MPSIKASIIRYCSICVLLLCLSSFAVVGGDALDQRPVCAPSESEEDSGIHAQVVHSASGPDRAESIQPPDLMRAEIYEEGIDLSNYWLSEKLDGVRAYWDGTRLISRGGLLIRAPDWFIADFPNLPLDGELWIGRGEFERVSGAARRLEPDPKVWAEMRYRVFDLPRADAPFGERLAMLQDLIAASSSPYLQAVQQVRVRDHTQLQSLLQETVDAGGEGLMLHRDDARYRGGRTDALLKVKPYFDAEARVIAHLPGKGRLENMLGALVVEEEGRGHRFRIGTGFSDVQRLNPPPVGSVVTFKYHGRTERGIPRFASFLRVRKTQ